MSGLRHEQLPMQSALLDDALQRPAPDLLVIRHNDNSTAVDCLFPHDDVTAGLPRLREAVFLQKIAEVTRRKRRAA